MAENGEHNGLAARTYTGLGRVTSTEFVWTEDDEESLRVLKLAGAFGIIMLLAYLAYDQFVWGRNGAGTAMHWLTLAATCLFFGVSWTQPVQAPLETLGPPVQPFSDSDRSSKSVA